MKKEKVNLVALVGKQMRTGDRLNAIEKQMPSKGDGEDKKSLRNLGKNTPGIYTGGINKKESGWTQDLGDKGSQDLTWLL